MATYLGRNASVKLGTVTVSELSEWTLDITADPIKQGTFGSTWGKTHGLAETNWNGSFSGLIDATDTTGQVVLESAVVSGTKINNLRLYIDGTYYYTPDTVRDSSAGCYITSYNTTATHGDVIKVSVSFEGTGPVHKIS